MNNFIEYFYGIQTGKVIYNDKYYSFIHNGYVYRLYIYEDNPSLMKFLYDTNMMLVGNTLMSEIIVKKFDKSKKNCI